MICSLSAIAQERSKNFSVIAFYTAKNDLAHISFVHEANNWFANMAGKHGFIYDSTSDWKKMDSAFLSKYAVVIFLDTRPDSLSQRKAFQQYMEAGGAWMGFHFSAFALTPSSYPQNWDWYHTTFLGSGEYSGNTWRPTSAVLTTENRNHPAVKKLPRTWRSAPNEWYRWKNDLRKNQNIKVLLSIDSSSFPLGTGPKKHEIWNSGDYPVAWTNKNYRMVYFNMGHNDMDYDGGTNRALSSSFDNPVQNRLMLQSLLWLGRKK